MGEGEEPQGVGAAGCALVLLAAGGSKRMGRPKQLLPLGGEAMVRRVVRAALRGAAGPVVVVVGAEAAAVRRELAGLPVEVVENAAWEEGMGSSLRVGMAAVRRLAPEAAGAIVALADRPDFGPEWIARLLAERARSGRTIVATRVAPGVERGGPPVWWAREHWAALEACRGEWGARQILAERAAEVALIEAPEGGWDVDTPEDYARAKAAWGE